MNIEKRTIEIQGNPVGIIKKEFDSNDWEFVAVKFHVWNIDGKKFPTPEKAIMEAQIEYNAHLRNNCEKLKQYV